MSLNKYEGGGGGGGGTQDVDIVAQSGANPLVVSDNNATARNVVLTGSTMPALPVSQTAPILINSATPVNVNLVSPDPVNVVFDNPETQLTLNKGNMTSLGSGRWIYSRRYTWRYCALS